MSGTPGRGSVAELVAKPAEAWGMPELVGAVQTAIELELSTLPPYLCAKWSIVGAAGAAACRQIDACRLIDGVVQEEMLHMGLMCNMLAGLGGTFDITPPKYPGLLPGGVRPDVTVCLSSLTKDVVLEVFMGIEYPEGGPVTDDARNPSPPTIGDFYDSISAAIGSLQPSFDETKQLTATIGPVAGDNQVFKIAGVEDAQNAIEEIKEQGEGTSTSPDAVDEGNEVAHYYRFGELYHGMSLEQVGTAWTYTAAPAVEWPQVYPCGEVAPGGWGWGTSLPQEITEFRTCFEQLLADLQTAFSTGSSDTLYSAFGAMRDLDKLGPQIAAMPRGDGSGLNYLPDFAPSKPPAG